jgi:hypothetical protein
MADAEVPQTQKESDNMSIFKRAHADDTDEAHRLESRANWNARSAIDPAETPWSHAHREHQGLVNELNRVRDQLDQANVDNLALRQKVADLNGECIAQQREITALRDQVSSLNQENRLISRRAQNVWTRAHVVGEAVDGLLRTALEIKEEADSLSKEPLPDATIDPLPRFLTAEMPGQAEG